MPNKKNGKKSKKGASSNKKCNSPSKKEIVDGSENKIEHENNEHISGFDGNKIKDFSKQLEDCASSKNEDKINSESTEINQLVSLHGQGTGDKNGSSAESTPPSERRMNKNETGQNMVDEESKKEDCEEEVKKMMSESEDEVEHEDLDFFRKLLNIKISTSIKDTLNEIHAFLDRSQGNTNSPKLDDLIGRYLQNENYAGKLAEITRWMHQGYRNVLTDRQFAAFEKTIALSLPKILQGAPEESFDDNASKLDEIIKEMISKNGLKTYQRIILALNYLNNIIVKDFAKLSDVKSLINILRQQFTKFNLMATRVYTIILHIRAVILVEEISAEEKDQIFEFGKLLTDEDWEALKVMIRSMCENYQEKKRETSAPNTDEPTSSSAL